MTDSSYDEAMRTRREVLGDSHVDKALADATDFTQPFQDLVTRYAWGEVWSRPGLDRRTRSCMTLAILVALRAHGEIPLHVRAALRNGVTVNEISEVFLHAAVYAGMPAANAAFAIASQVFEDDSTP
jgi:4-carboxymuconolactone decarboxylase